MKHLMVFLSFLLAGFAVQSSAQTIAASKIVLSQTDKQNSALFQSLKGSDRTSVFYQLRPLIRVKDAQGATTSSVRIGAKATKIGEVVALLGQPDTAVQKSFLQYNLTADASQRLIIGIAKTGEVSFCTVKN